MKQGDFTKVAKHYHNRPAYSMVLLEKLLACINDEKKSNKDIKVAEIGAGTGKLTKMLYNLGLNVSAVEPNFNMRKEGEEYTKNCDIKWLEGSGENTSLEENSQDWLIMASSFHWTNPSLSLPEFARVLKANGYFTAIWNPRDLQEGSIFYEIEEEIKQILPSLKRVSSGSQNTKDWTSVIQSTQNFKDCFFMEIPYIEHMSKERYMGAWQSVNDIQAQAGEKFKDILNMIESKISELEIISVPYKIRAWTAKKV